MSKRRKSKSARHSKQPRDADGNPLCRECRGAIIPPKRTFCSPVCIHVWKVRSSPSYARKCVFERDKGICAECGIDTKKITVGFRKPLKGETVLAWKRRVATVKKQYSIPKHRKTYYDVDHIVPVCEGGGETDLSGLRILCLPCHQTCTNELMKKRRNKLK